MTKICFIIPSLGSGGAERVFSEIIRYLDKSKYDVTLVLLLSKGIHFEKIESLNIKVECFNGKNLTSLSLLIRLIKYLRKSRFNTIISTLMQLNMLIGLFKIFYKNSYLIAREANIPSIYLSDKSYGKIFAFCYPLIMSKFDAIICQSKNMRDDLINNFSIKNRLVVINNPAPLCANIKESSAKQNLVKFVVVSRLSKQKGIDRLIRMAASCSSNFEIDIFGEGVERTRLEKLINKYDLSKRIRLKGIHKNILSELVHYDCFLLPSYYEGFPNALLEAQSVGLPGISFNILGGIDEIIDNEMMGVICDTEEDFIQAISCFNRELYDSYLIAKMTNKKFGYYETMKKYEKCILGEIF